MNAISLKRSNAILAIGVLIAFLYYPSVGIITFRGSGYTVNTLFISRLFIWLEVFILYFYATWVEKAAFLLWWPERKQTLSFYIASLAGLYLLGIGAGIVSKIPLLFGLHDSRQIMLHMVAVANRSLPLLIFSAITAGFTEELIFRGYLVPRLELLFKNRHMPVIVSSLMFGFVHFRYESYTEVIFAALFGAVFAIHYQVYRNIKILIFTHACIDLVSFFIFRFALHYHLPIK